MVSPKNKPHNFMVQNLSVSYLNINGLHRKEFGCKLGSFQNEIFQHDIVILSETWGCNHEKDIIKDYKNITEIKPTKMKGIKNGRDSGGTLVYVHNSIHKLIIATREHKNYCIFRVSKHLVPKIGIDVVIAATYIPPERSPYFSDQILDNLKHDLYEIQNEDNVVIVLGDMNARTSNLPDNSETAGFQHMSNIQLENEGVFIQRQNCDKETNKNGKSLIEFCKNLNLRTLNGRKVGDLYGKFTCFSNGASSVDYGIASEGLF